MAASVSHGSPPRGSPLVVVSLVGPQRATRARLGDPDPVRGVAVAKCRGALPLATPPAGMAGRQLAVRASAAGTDGRLSGPGTVDAVAERGAISRPGCAGEAPVFLDVGPGVCGRQAPWAEVMSQADGSYTATLGGHFTLRVSGDHPFRVRLLMLCLRLLEGPTPQRGSRRMRDGRTPFVTQAQLAAWFGLPQPDISRLERYWLEGIGPTCCA